MTAKRVTLLFIVTVLALLSTSAIAAGFARAKLGNGLTVLVIEDHSTDLAAIDVWVSAGSVNENAANNGVSHLIEHLVFAGSKKYASGGVDVEAESLGATLDAHTTRDWARFSTTVASRYLKEAIGLLAETVINPTFPEESLAREKLVILDEIARKQSINRKVCDDKLWEAVMGDHPYSLPIEGTPERIKSITRQQIVDYYNSLYTADNATIVIVGDIDGQTAVDAVGAVFKDMPRKAKLPDIADLSYLDTGKQLSFSSAGTQGCVGIGFAGPPASLYDDVCAVDLLLAYMGYGYRSWMEEELVNKTDLATGTWSDFLTHKYPGLISLTATAENQNLEKIKDTILKKLESIANDGVSEADISRARRSLLGQFAFQNETFEGRANTYGFYDRISDANFGDTYIERIQAVTSESIKRVAAKYMIPSKACVVLVKSKE